MPDRIVWTLSIDATKAYDYFNHGLIIANQDTYGVAENYLILNSLKISNSL